LGLRGGVGGTWYWRIKPDERPHQFLDAWFLDERASWRLRGTLSAEDERCRRHGRLRPRLDSYGRAFVFAGQCSGTSKVLPARPDFAGHPRQTTGKRDPYMSRGSLGAVKRVGALSAVSRMRGRVSRNAGRELPITFLLVEVAKGTTEPLQAERKGKGCRGSPISILFEHHGPSCAETLRWGTLRA